MLNKSVSKETPQAGEESGARERILGKLRAISTVETGPTSPSFSDIVKEPMSLNQRVASLRKCLEENRAKVQVIAGISELEKEVNRILEEKRVPGVFVDENEFPELARKYDSDIRYIKRRAYKLDLSITRAKAAIADVGALVIIPGTHEPRLATLAVPHHLILLRSEDIFDSMSDFFSSDYITTGKMPSNLLFVSGPSKTADIEGRLCFGIHGPINLTVLIL